MGVGIIFKFKLYMYYIRISIWYHRAPLVLIRKSRYPYYENESNFKNSVTIAAW